MSNGSWDKRQWELLNDAITKVGSGPNYIRISPASTLLGVVIHDYIAYTYVGENITETKFYVGGSGGTLVSTLQYSYNASGNITAVTRV